MTIRGVSAAVEKAIAREAKRNRLSINKAVLALLGKGAGVDAPAPKTLRYTELDHLAGSWAREEAAAFNQALGEQRRVEDGLWSTKG